MLGDLLKALFVPSEEKITALIDTVKSKFDFIETIKIAINSLYNVMEGIGTAPKLKLDIPSTKYTPAFTSYIDFAWFEPYKNYSDLIITGFVYALYLWRLFVKLPATVNGSSGTIEAEGYTETSLTKRG